MEHDSKRIQQFIDDDSFVHANLQSLLLSQDIAKQKKWVPIVEELQWNSFRDHPFKLCIIENFSQVFNLARYVSDEIFRIQQRQELVKKLQTQRSELFRKYLKKSYSKKSVATRSSLDLLSSHGFCMPQLNKDGVEIRDSSVEGAGYGVFALRKIRKGEPLGYYGEIGFSHAENSEFSRCNRKYGDYAFSCKAIGDHIPESENYAYVYALTIESKSVKNSKRSSSWVQFINQTFDFRNLNCVFQNVEYAPFVCPELNEALIVPPMARAIRDIEPGEELFIDYGFDYWKGRRNKIANVWKDKDDYNEEWKKVSYDYETAEPQWNELACEKLQEIDFGMHVAFRKYHIVK